MRGQTVVGTLLTRLRRRRRSWEATCHCWNILSSPQSSQGIVLAVLIRFGTWLFRRTLRPEIRVVTSIEQGPTNRELGFTEPAVKVALTTRSDKDIQINDIRLMFCGRFGASVAPEAPAGRSHPELPVSLASGTENEWFIPAEKLSSLLRSLHRPPEEDRNRRRCGEALCAMHNRHQSVIQRSLLLFFHRSRIPLVVNGSKSAFRNQASIEPVSLGQQIVMPAVN